MNEQNYNQGFQPQEAQTMSQAQQVPTTIKKPMKLGWIITLALFVMSLIGVSIGGVLTATNDPVSIVKNIDSQLENYREGQEGFVSEKNLSSNEKGFTYKGLTKGKAYIFVFLQTDGNLIENITFDNQTVHPFFSDYSSSRTYNSRAIKNCKYYYVVANGSEMKINIDNIKGTAGRIALSDSKEITSKFESLTTGALLLLIFGIATVLTFIAFAAFLIIYLVKNNKYKAATRNVNY